MLTVEARPRTGSVQRQRGRPQHPATVGSAQARVAWLLRAHRLHHTPRTWHSTSDFVNAFAAGEFADRVSISSVSRWETGAVRAAAPVIRGYEELTGVPRGRLLAIADILYRASATTVAAGPTLPRQRVPTAGSPRHVRLDDLLERAVGDDPRSGVLTIGASHPGPGGCLSGPDWDELTELLAATAVVVSPRAAWDALATRLFAEVCVANRLAWMQRFEAFLRLLGHPSGRRAAVAAVAAAISDPRDSSMDREVAHHLLTQLEHSPEPRARSAGVLACLNKLHLGCFPARAQQERPADLVRVAGSVSASVRTLVLERGQVDDVLPTLVEEMLCDPAVTVRVNAALLLYASPFAPAVAAAVASEIVRGRAMTDATIGPPLLRGLRLMGGSTQRYLVERLILGPGLPREVTDAAVQAIGHLEGSSSDMFWWSAVTLQQQAWRRDRSLLALRHLVQALGIARNGRVLARIWREADMPEAVRLAAAWWLSRLDGLVASVDATVDEATVG